VFWTNQGTEPLNYVDGAIRVVAPK
jgi:hypothetical protein